MPKLFLGLGLFQKLLHRFGINVGGRLEAATFDDFSHAAHRELHVLSGVLAQASLEGIEVPGEGSALLRGESLRVGIDQAALAEHDLVLELGRELLGEPAVGETLAHPPLAVLVIVADIPDAAPLRLVAALFENRRHLIPPAAGSRLLSIVLPGRVSTAHYPRSAPARARARH
ncbi:MAG TPA: hypothetical protein PK867_24100 [Pirellulales bacterium]|nr:hypothetical protein [Pirellulales bacterium]